MQATITNRTFDEIQPGDAATLMRTVRQEDIALFAAVSGDINPAHLDRAYAEASSFGGLIAHGSLSGALISAVLGTLLPGPGTIYLSQSLHFLRPVRPGDRLEVRVSVREKVADKQRVWLDCVCTNQDGKAVVKGEAEVIAPTRKISRPGIALPPLLFGDEPYAIIS